MDNTDINKDIKGALKKARHKAEIPLYVIAVILNIAVLVLLTLCFIYHGKVRDVLVAWLGIDNDTTELLAGVGYWFIPVFLIIAVFRILYEVKKMYHGCYFSGVKVSANQFPEIYEVEQELGRALGFEKVPKVFISSSASTCTVLNIPISTPTFVCVSPGVAVYTPDIAKFEIARNFAHIYYGHRWLVFYVSTFCAHAIPVFGKMFRRCLEYSADRAAQMILGDDVALDCLIKSSVHYLVVRKMNVEEYYHRITSPCGWEASVYYSFMNLTSNEPINRYRINAMAMPKDKYGRLL